MIAPRRLVAWALWGCAILSGPAAAQQDGYPPFPGPAGYKVAEDPMREAVDAVNANADRQHAPFYVQAAWFDVTRENGPDRSYEDKKALSEYWGLSIANLLEQNGFRVAEEWKIRQHTGLSIAQFRQKMIDSLPYAGRDLAEQHAGKGIRILINEHPPGCSGDNGYMALVLPYYPTEDVASDFGGLETIIVGGGPCASGAESRSVLDGMLEKVRHAVVGE